MRRANTHTLTLKECVCDFNLLPGQYADLYGATRDERKIGETLESAWRQRPYDESKIRSMDPKFDPLGPATVHGNEPSKGAKIDAELKAADEEGLRKKAEHKMKRRAT